MKKSRKARAARLPASHGPSAPAPPADQLLADIRALIDEARGQVAQAVNAGLVTLYWHIGRRIRQEILGEQRAAYGEQIVNSLSAQLTAEYGRGFSRPSLFRMMQFAEMFPDEKIVAALRRQLSWTHFRELIAIDDPLKREFYAEMCRAERWSTRTLQDQIKRMVYERTAVSKKPEGVIQAEIAALRDEDRLTPDLVFRDPYFLDFLGLLFYHRRLRRLVAMDLKLGRFRAADKGQMELYLRWLQEHETHAHEEPPIGLILCVGKSAEQVRLLRLEAAGIRVAEYLTELPPREVLERKLHDAIRLAREQLARRAAAEAEVKRLPPRKATAKKKAAKRRGRKKS